MTLETIDSKLIVFKKTVPAGTVILGGNNAPIAAGAESNYSIIVAPTEVSMNGANDVHENLFAIMGIPAFNQMSSHYELKSAGTQYVFANPGNRYFAYALPLSGNMGFRNLTAGTYRLTWYDLVTGNRIIQNNISIGSGDRSFSKPSRIGNDVALYLERVDSTGDSAPP
jgi:hypothetical protein